MGNLQKQAGAKTAKGTKKQKRDTQAKAQGGSSFPQPLSQEDEKYNISKYESGTPAEKKQAKDTLIERNLRLVAHIVKKFHHQDAEDLISIGTIGLIKGISSFDSAKGVRLATYASRCIENEIRMHLRATRKHQGDVSIQDPIGTDREGNKITYEEKLADDSEELSEIVALRIQVKFLYDKLAEVLDEREREIIEMRYGLRCGEEITQREIGKLLNISRSYVSRLEKKALEKLNREFHADSD